jgi:hypothetical protein
LSGLLLREPSLPKETLLRKSLEKDWSRLKRAFEQFREHHWNPSLIASVEIYDLRKYDRGIDYPLRRLLDSREYGMRIRVFGCPSSQFGRHPFRWNEKVWSMVRVKEFLVRT